MVFVVAIHYQLLFPLFVVVVVAVVVVVVVLLHHLHHRFPFLDIAPCHFGSAYYRVATSSLLELIGVVDMKLDMPLYYPHHPPSPNGPTPPIAIDEPSPNRPPKISPKPNDPLVVEPACDGKKLTPEVNKPSCLAG